MQIEVGSKSVLGLVEIGVKTGVGVGVGIGVGVGVAVAGGACPLQAVDERGAIGAGELRRLAWHLLRLEQGA